MLFYYSLEANKKSVTRKSSPLRFQSNSSTKKSGSKPRTKPVSGDKKHKFKQSPISPQTRSISVTIHHNRDLNDIITSPNSFKSPKPQKSRSGSKSGKKQSKLPRLNFSGLLDENKSVSQFERPTNNHAIDSNRAIAFAYYTRRLMLLGWRSLFNYRLEKIEKRFYERICNQKMVKCLKQKAIKGFKQFTKMH